MPTVSCGVLRDTYADSAQVNSNYGTVYALQAGYYKGSTYPSRAYIQFDLSAIPARATINSATLSFTYTTESTGGTKNVGLGEVTGGWSETLMTWNNKPTHNNLANYGMANSGGSASPASKSINDATIRDLVQRWANGSANNGLVFYEVQSPDHWIYILSREDVRAPSLTVDYTPPNAAPYAPAPQTPSNGGWYSTGSPRVSWIYNDPDGNPQAGWAVHIIDHNTGTVVRDTGWIYNGSNFWDISPALPSGTYRYRIITYDGLLQSPWSWEPIFYVDVTPPYASGPDGAKYGQGSVRFYLYGVGDAFAGVSYVNSYMLRNDGVSWMVYEGKATNAGGGTWYYDFPTPSDGVQGAHLVRFHIIDGVGNWSGAYDTTYYYDTVAPTIGSGDGNRYSSQNSGTIRHTISNVADATSGILHTDFYWRKSTNSGGAWGVWSGVLVGIQSGTNWYYDIPISGDGLYQVDVHSYDRAGNEILNTMYTTIDSVMAANPNALVVYDQTIATFTWDTFFDPNPSSGYNRTVLWLGEWDGTGWVGGIPNVANGTTIATSTSTLTYNVTGLVAGKRYRYSISHYDNAGVQSAYTWQEFITKKKIGEIDLQGQSSVIILPIYDPASGVLGNKATRIQSTTIICCFEELDIASVKASPIRLQTSTHGIKSLAKM